jgi:hypothetical protein
MDLNYTIQNNTQNPVNFAIDGTPYTLGPGNSSQYNTHFNAVCNGNFSQPTVSFDDGTIPGTYHGISRQLSVGFQGSNYYIQGYNNYVFQLNDSGAIDLYHNP